MKYKIYIIKTDDVTKVVTFIEAEINCEWGFDTVEEAKDRIEGRGDAYIHYVILPYVYMPY